MEKATYLFINGIGMPVSSVCLVQYPYVHTHAIRALCYPSTFDTNSIFRIHSTLYYYCVQYTFPLVPPIWFYNNLFY